MRHKTVGTTIDGRKFPVETKFEETLQSDSVFDVTVLVSVFFYFLLVTLHYTHVSQINVILLFSIFIAIYNFLANNHI